MSKKETWSDISSGAKEIIHGMADLAIDAMESATFQDHHEHRKKFVP